MNGIGLWTLFGKECRRFSKVWMQTVFSPLVTTSLYFLVFGVALGSRLQEIDGLPYIRFVVPGLILLGVITNSFLNTSSSLFQSKINQTLVDLLTAPIGAVEMVAAYVGAAVLRGLTVGVLVWAVAGLFSGFTLLHPLWTILFAVGVAATFACFGLAAAIWAEKFDHLSIFPNFVLTPLTFLGGVFYSVTMLPQPWNTISHANPILYLVNGLRWGLFGVSDVPVWSCALVLLGLGSVAAGLVSWMFATGYRLRS
jgi:ABC-2 type transport system permease protein